MLDRISALSVGKLIEGTLAVFINKKLESI